MRTSHRFMLLMLLLLTASLLSLNCARELTEEQLAQKALDIHDKVLTVDTHADTPYNIGVGEWKIGERHEPNKRGSGDIDLPRMAEGGLDAEFFAVYVGQGSRTTEGYVKAKNTAQRLFDAVHGMCDTYPDMVELATTPDDAYRIEKLGKRAAFIGIENGYAMGLDLAMLKEYHALGARYITLCHNGNNDICDSSTDRNGLEHHGLSAFGEKVVAEMNRLGIMVDMSHAADETFYDVIALSKAPIIASHSCARALCDHNRNMTDDMIKTLAEHDGVIQICFVSDFVKEAQPNPERDAEIAALREKYGEWNKIKDEKVREQMREDYYAIRQKYAGDRASVEDLVNHIDHVVELVGIDHVGIGTDFDGGGGVVGCSEVSQLPSVTIELVKRGYSEEQIRKIWGGNIMRVLTKVLEVSKELQNS